MLLLLLKCPEPSLRAGAADILANVAHSEVLREKIVAHGALQTLLGELWAAAGAPYLL